MKLRHKASGVVIEGCFSTRLGGYEPDNTNKTSWYCMTEWEKVPEERWVPATDLRLVVKHGDYIIERKECC